MKEKGLKVVLLVFFISLALWALYVFFFPTSALDMKLLYGDVLSARYDAVLAVAIAAGAWYAFRNPVKNVAIVRVLIAATGLSALLALFNGLTGREEWGAALGSILWGGLFALALGYFYPKGAKAT